MEENTQVEQLAGEVRANWGWLLFVGIALVVLGTIGLYMVGTLTLVSILYFGVLVIAGGVLTLIDAFKAEGWKAKLWEILIGVLYIVAGLIMILYPGASAVWFTAFIAAFLLVSGIFRIIMGFQVRSEVKGWGWIVFGGAASIVLALVKAAITASFATMMPVRAPGRPSLDRLSTRMVVSFQCGFTSENRMLGNGIP